jgi:hypothetical protein
MPFEEEEQASRAAPGKDNCTPRHFVITNAVGRAGVWQRVLSWLRRNRRAEPDQSGAGVRLF